MATVYKSYHSILFLMLCLTVNFLCVGQINSLKLLSADSLKRLKAIIVVGPVEDSYDRKIIEGKKRVASYLKQLGIKVQEFYPPHDKWGDIVKASKGAHIFIYSGHGSMEGINYPSGGLCLSGNIYSARSILTDLKLHKHALIIFNSACNAAGSSATDLAGITKEEATKRVAEYAFPFYKLKAGAYYANNYEGIELPFLKAFLYHQNAKAIYFKEASEWQTVMGFAKYSYDPSYVISLAGTDHSCDPKVHLKSNKPKSFCKDFNAAFVGDPKFSVVDFFKN